MIKLHKGKVIVHTNKYERSQEMYVSDLDGEYVELKSNMHNYTFFLRRDSDMLSEKIVKIK